jgi:hypothetical protein
MGIPTMVVTREGFSQVVSNAFAGVGFPAEGPTIYEFPMPMFDAGSDITPINENIDKIVYGLTKWQPKITTKGVFAPPMITVQGKDYADALNNMEILFVKNNWSDGLPLKPATEERVKSILTGTDLAPDKVIGTVPARGGIADVNSIAVALAMAGGRPEYLPLLIAAVQSLADPKFGLSATNPTTCSVIPAIVVNGPVAKQIRLGSGYGLLGPDPAHPAGQIIGRALRIILQDLGGALPGTGTMAIFGGMRETNAVFAEDEEGLPKGWNSLAVDRGFSKTDNVATASAVAGMSNIMVQSFGDKVGNDQGLLEVAKFMSAPSVNTWGPFTADTWTSKDLAQGIILIARGYANSLSSVSGYSKLDVKTNLWNNSKIPWSLYQSTGLQNFVDRMGNPGIPVGQDVPLSPKPEQLTIVVAGGDQAGHVLWMEAGNSNRAMISTKIELPKNWDALIKQAEAELGPIPAAH